MPLSVPARNAAITTVTDLMGGGSLQIATDDTFSEILATFPLPNPYGGAATDGSRSSSPIPNAVALASGNAEALQILSAENNLIYERTDELAVTAQGGGGVCEMQQQDTQIIQGQAVSITLQFTLAGGQ